MGNTDTCKRIGWLAVVALLGAAAPALGQASFTGLGDLAGGTVDSRAWAVTADGSVVVGTGRTSTCNLAFRWTAGGGLVSLGELPGGQCNSQAFAVSSDGLTIAGESDSTLSGFSPEAMRWTQAGGMVGLGDLPGGSFVSFANGISGDGSIVVGIGQTSVTFLAFIWTAAGGMVSLGDLPGGGLFSRADAISADGSVVVGRSTSAGGDGSDCEAFRWTQAGGMVGIGDLPGGVFHSEALAVSADGSVIVGTSRTASGDEAFRWTAATGMVSIGDLPGGDVDAIALAVSADGSVVVGSSEAASGIDEAFIWDAANGMRRLQTVLTNDFGLDLSGWILRDATGISADGTTIVGFATRIGIGTEAWIATLAPTPPCTLLGDLNQDGVINGDDIYGFVRLIIGLPPEPGEDPSCADFGTGTAEGDTAAFIIALLN